MYEHASALMRVHSTSNAVLKKAATAMPSPDPPMQAGPGPGRASDYVNWVPLHD